MLSIAEINSLEAENKKLKQALQEIKEIVKIHKISDSLFRVIDSQKAKEIWLKISEVEE